MQTQKYLSLFSGIGGFELGIGKRANCIGFAEINKHAIQIYQKHFPDHKHYGDITTITEQELPDFDLLVAGFPCQAFSIAGKRCGFSDTRGTMFFEVARIVRKKQPRLLLLENVKGLLSHNKGRTFTTIITTLDELGYDCQWQVLNSKNYGVPQNRERVFIVGHLRGTPRPKVFPLTGSHGSIDADRSNSAKQQDRSQPRIAAERGRYSKDGTLSQKLEVRKDALSNTLTSVEKDNRVIDDRCLRRLTPVECERLQGFPDNWTRGISDSQRYKCLGNAVTVNVIKVIASRMLRSMRVSN